jgi:hypothetical protein
VLIPTDKAGSLGGLLGLTEAVAQAGKADG